MTRSKIFITTLFGAAVAAAAAVITTGGILISQTAFAQAPNPGADVPQAELTMPQAELTMAQAVTIAETMGDGRAVRARLGGSKEQPIYKVTVSTPGAAPLKLQIAAAGGRVVASERDDDH